MQSVVTELTRDSALEFIASSCVFGNLCLFIGAGFSKELVGSEALSWGELLKRAAADLKIEFDFTNVGLIGTGFPEIASLMCRSMAEQHGGTIDDAMLKIKNKVAELTCWHPDDKKKTFYANQLSSLDPAWIITTNYDLVIESLMPGRSISIGPDQPLVFPRGRIPVYHLHGMRSYPESLVLCREDYTALFRPNEYRQIKLALTLKESTTLLLGYALGDDNVLTALDWSKNVFDNEVKSYPSAVVQVLRCKEPRHTPYKVSNGAVIIEVASLDGFFSELQPFVEAEKAEQEAVNKSFANVRDALIKTPDTAVNKFIDIPEFRQATLNIVNHPEHHRVIEGFIPFFDKCIDETFTRSAGYNKFAGYNQGLILVLDILSSYGDSHIPPALFQKIANALHRQAPYIGFKNGQSRVAGTTWAERKASLPAKQISEIKVFAQSKEWSLLIKLLE